jgi:hypothetical protein
MLRCAIAMDISFTTARPEYFFTNPRVSRRTESGKITPRSCKRNKASGIITTLKTAANHLFGFFGPQPPKNTSVLCLLYESSLEKADKSSGFMPRSLLLIDVFRKITICLGLF